MAKVVGFPSVLQGWEEGTDPIPGAFRYHGRMFYSTVTEENTKRRSQEAQDCLVSVTYSSYLLYRGYPWGLGKELGQALYVPLISQ